MPLNNPIPAEALESDIAIIGKKGRGKTYTAKGCVVEPLLRMGRRVVVLDPLSTWWGLKVRADGEAGFPIVVIGGPHADIPLDPNAGEPLGKFLAKADMSVVLDLGSLSRSAMISFATDFLEALFTDNRQPLWLVLEEADVFAPQNPSTPATKVMHDEVDRIARRGRNFGFRLVTLTQRPARLSKDVLTQLSTLVALGVSGPHDREALKAWIEGNADRADTKEVTNSLASLAVGEGWVWAPDQGMLERVRFPQISTLDTSKTPKAGEKAVEIKALARGDVEALREAMKPPAPPETPATPAKAAAGPSQAEIEAIRAAGIEIGRKEGFYAAQKVFSVTLRKLFDGLTSDLQRGMWAGFDEIGKVGDHVAVLKPVHDTTHGVVPAKPPPPPRKIEGKVSAAVTKIIAYYEAVYPRAVSFDAAAKQAGVGMKSSQYRTYEPELQALGVVEDLGGGRYRALRQVGSPDEYLDAVEAQLAPKHKAVFKFIRRAGRPVTREEIVEAAEISPTSSTTSAALALLIKEAEVIEQVGDGYQLVEAYR